VSSATGTPELAAFVEAPAAFTAERPGTRIIRSERFTLLADATGRWPMAVQRIRLRPDELDDAVEAARSLMRVTGTTAASWWLSEHSTPAGIEEELLARGMQIVEGDYLVDGMALTREPPVGPPDVEARAVASAAEFVEALHVQYDAFDTPELRRRSETEILEEYEQTLGDPVATLYVAWVDGRIAAAGRSFFSPRGALLAGGSTALWARGRGAYRALVRARWDDAVARGTPALAVQAGAMSAPILRGLGFEQVCLFRRMHDVGLQA
jgi:hypothetical protein